MPMPELIQSAFAMGWPILLALAALIVYLLVHIRDPNQKRQMLSKGAAAFLAMVLFLIAVANVRMNFFGDSRLLPVSLALITLGSFLMALYFVRLNALFKIGGFMFLVAAALAGFGNWLPQVEGGFAPGPEGPPDPSILTAQELADEGEKIIFGGIGLSRMQGAIGKGQCPLCHGFNEGYLSERAPNLFGVIARAKQRLEDPRYHKGKPLDRDTVQKEAVPGSGTAETVQEYIAESHVCPSCYVVSGYGQKGTNDRESPMARVNKPPISLTVAELAMVDTWFYVREGKEPPAYSEIVKAYEKFISEAERKAADQITDDLTAHKAIPVISGRDSVDQIFSQAKCVLCHTIPGISGAVGIIGPKLVEKTNAPLRLKDPAYHGQAKTVRDYVMESVISPGTYVAKPFQDNVMPRDFGERLSAGALNKIVDYLSRLEEGKAPPTL
jgi:cytochrome c2